MNKAERNLLAYLEKCMTIEISRNLEWIYRISPDDPLLIERKRNVSGSRWTFYLHRDTASEAKAALLQLEVTQ